MQKESGLQGASGDVAPVDDPVEGIELRRVLEGIQDEGDQAEDVEMRRFRRGPSPEEHIKADAQIDQRNETQALVDGAIGRHKDDLNIKPRSILQVRSCEPQAAESNSSRAPRFRCGTSGGPGRRCGRQDGH